MSHPARKLRHIRAEDSLAAEDDAPWWHAFVNGTHSLIEHAILTRGALELELAQSRAGARVIRGTPFCSRAQLRPRTATVRRRGFRGVVAFFDIDMPKLRRPPTWARRWKA